MTVNNTCQADEVTSVVIDIGSSWTRVGYSGENLPKHVVPTSYGKDGEGNYYFGDEQVNAVHKGKEIYAPMADGCVQDWNAISRLWKWIYDTKLCVDPSEFPLVVTEQVWNPVANKQRALEVAFEDLQVPIFSLVKAPLCAAYEHAYPTALVVDVGSAVASVTPVVDGQLLSKASFHTRFAGDFLNLHILAHMRQLNMPLTAGYAVEDKSTVDPGQQAQPKLKQFPEGHITESYDSYQLQRMLNEFKESTLQVSEIALNSTNNQMTSAMAPMSRPFEFPTGYNLSFGPERLTTTEPLFRPTHYTIPGVSLPEGQSQGLGDLMYAALSKAPQYVSGPHSMASEVTTSLLSNVILTGGTGQLARLPERMSNEIAQWTNNYKPNITQPERPTAVWTGASIIASMGQFDQPHWVSKQEYEEYGTNIVEKRFK